MNTIVFRVAVIAVVVAVALAGYFASQPEPRAEPAFAITAECDIASVPFGPGTVAFTVTNPANKPRRIIGCYAQCQAAGCMDAKSNEQITIAPGETIEYQCDYDVYKPGPFELKLDVFLEDNGIRTVTLTVRGVGVAAGGKTDAPKP